MKIRKKIINQFISMLMLVIYLLGSLSILSFHNHNHDDNHHHDSVICENINSLNISDCSHQSHITTTQESCSICDHFSNCKNAILDFTIKSDLVSFTIKEVQLLSSLFLIDAANTQNKSPPSVV